MIIDTRWWARAAAHLPPTHYTTDSGLRVQADWTNTRTRSSPWTNAVRIAWRAYLPAEGKDTNKVVLFIPGERLSGQIYDEAAQRLAEQGIPSFAMSLAPNGIGHWHSSDPAELRHLSLRRCLDLHVIPIIWELQKPDNQLFLAGDGLGGILAQLYAVNHPTLAGLILMGSCSPQRASAVWPALPLEQPYAWRPPSPAEIRQTLLDETAADEEVLTLRRELGPLPLRIRQDYQHLASQDFNRPQCPVLILAGEQDHTIHRSVLEKTAADYEQPLILVPDAPHLLMLSQQCQAALGHIETFVGAVTE